MGASVALILGDHHPRSYSRGNGCVRCCVPQTILAHYTRKMPLAADVSISALATRSTKYDTVVVVPTLFMSSSFSSTSYSYTTDWAACLTLSLSYTSLVGERSQVQTSRRFARTPRSARSGKTRTLQASRCATLTQRGVVESRAQVASRQRSVSATQSPPTRHDDVTSLSS